MSAAAQVRQTFPEDLGRGDQSKPTACIEAYRECGQRCSAFPEACLSEDMVDTLSKFLRTNMDNVDRADV